MALWTRFKQRYPNADFSRFSADKFFGRPNVMFHAKDGLQSAVFDSDSGDFQPSLYFSDEMKQALGLTVGFPLELTLNPKPALSVPAVTFSGVPHHLEVKKLQIYATPNEFFTVPVREIFTHTQITHYGADESRRWLAGPNMSYWPQQLNFALWCATTGCGVSQRLLFEDKMADGKTDVTDSELHLPPQIRSILWFHVYFTVRRILFQMGGIQSELALPGDSSFSQTDNKYDVPSYKRLCKEFSVPPSASFRFEKGANHGLGSVYIWFTNEGPHKTGYPYPGHFKFSDEGGKGLDGNLIQYIRNTESANGYEYFVTPVSHGLTNAGQARLNQSIEALVYCVLGAQVNVRSSILGNSGSAEETRREFLELFESAVRQPDISKSVQRFQLAVQEAKVRLDLAVSPGTWLMPSKLVLNMESTVGYNNELKRASEGMRLGVNSTINMPTKNLGIMDMSGGPTKTHRPNNHPSNQIHSASGQTVHDTKVPTDKKQTSHDIANPHDALKIGIIGGVALVVFAMFRAGM